MSGPARKDVVIDFEHRKCSRCQQIKHVSEMQTRRDRRNSRGHCKECNRAYLADYEKAWREKNKEMLQQYQREYREKNAVAVKQAQRVKGLRMKYGLSLEGYDALYAAQHGKCAICGAHQTEMKRPLSVDHCHATGIIRGLLCHSCNVMLGLADDSIERLDAAKQYLTQHSIRKEG